ncbi:type II toxin-antitoxin system VapC family toxin [Methylomagnum ishizawai]|uniref:type II toxin-antitoxin system VapC family toxin n=1 Tax=Methylomagnum ishizawai TaxID=1760988 RepID=UPI001C329B00|nr:type II toxin-antitoxin system VapC family toxin [Methylomagnum ishizawai]BBL76260.1 twitching motility protein PilT [Methylomagnum ishizawai]
MYLIDTNVISELRKKQRAHPGVRRFFEEAMLGEIPLYLSAVTLGELRRGVEAIRHRGDSTQADLLERWLQKVHQRFQGRILVFDEAAAETWGRLRVPHPENPLDKQIAATALIHNLTVVTRNDKDFLGTGVKVRNPFLEIE